MGACATCSLCQREMAPGVRCDRQELLLAGQVYRRWTFESIYGGNCGDCNAPVGGTHHGGCAMERCPRCGFQLLACGCLEAVPSLAYDRETGDLIAFVPELPAGYEPAWWVAGADGYVLTDSFGVVFTDANGKQVTWKGMHDA